MCLVVERWCAGAEVLTPVPTARAAGLIHGTAVTHRTARRHAWGHPVNVPWTLAATWAFARWNLCTAGTLEG